jgi:folate-binding protein YgfZ
MPLWTPLHELQARAGAAFVEQAGWEVPADFGDPWAESQSAWQSAALFDLSDLGKLELTGRDAGSFLHNLCTNDLKNLPVGAGCEAFLTNAQARVLAHVYLYHLPPRDGQPVYWVTTTPDQVQKVLAHLNHYLISEQVEIADRTPDYALLHLVGPNAEPTLGMAEAVLPGFPTRDGQVVPHDRLALPGFDILCLRDAAEAVWGALVEACARPAGREAFRALRVEAGTPVYGVDFDESNLAPEVGRTRQAISFTKGCYLGQEPIVRIRDLGHVNRTLVGLKLTGEKAVARGTKLLRDGKEVGQVTSSVVSPRLGTAIALAYVRRGSHEPGTRLQVTGADGTQEAEVVSLPFVPSGALPG